MEKPLITFGRMQEDGPVGLALLNNLFQDESHETISPPTLIELAEAMEAAARAFRQTVQESQPPEFQPPESSGGFSVS